MPTIDPVLIAAFSALPGLIGAYFAYRQSTKVAEKAAHGKALEIESGAYERARKMYENGIAQLEEQLDRMRHQMLEERAISAKLRRQVAELEDTVAQLRKQLARSGIELAPPASSGDAETV